MYLIMVERSKSDPPFHKLPEQMRRAELESKMKEIEISEIDKSTRRLRERETNLSNPGPTWDGYVGYIEAQRRFRRLQKTNPKRARINRIILDSQAERQATLDKQLHELKQEIGAGKNRLVEAETKIKKIRKRRQITGDFLKNPVNSDRFGAFVDLKADEWKAELERMDVSPSLTDRLYASGGGSSQATSTTTLLATLWAYLSTTRPGEINIPSGGPSKQLSILLRSNNIKNILEVGTSSRGLVHVLNGLGIPKQSGAKVFALNYDKNDLPDDGEKVVAEVRCGDALNAAEIYPDLKFDLIILQGVLSFGGLHSEQWDECTRRLDYSPIIGKAQGIIYGLSQTLSKNPNASIVASSIRGVLALSQNEESESVTVHQRIPASSNARCRLRDMLTEGPNGLSRQDYAVWREKHQTEIDKIDEFMRNSSSTIIYKRRPVDSGD
jgi:hypothetical protein